MSSLSTLEAPTAILAATEGIGLAALGLGKEAHIELLYKSQVSAEPYFGTATVSRVSSRTASLAAGCIVSYQDEGLRL